MENFTITLIKRLFKGCTVSVYPSLNRVEIYPISYEEGFANPASMTSRIRIVKPYCKSVTVWESLNNVSITY